MQLEIAAWFVSFSLERHAVFNLHYDNAHGRSF